MRHLNPPRAGSARVRGPGTPGWFRAALMVAPVVLVGTFFVWPLATLFGRGVLADGAVDVLASGDTWAVVWFTCWQAAASTALAMLVGLPAAWATARYAFRGRSALLSALTAVFVLPTVVVAAAITALLPGPLERGIWAILAAHVVFNVAVVVRVVGTAWAALPTSLEQAAATLGATPATALRTVVWPLLRPATWSAAAIVYLFTFTSFGVVRVLGGPNRTTIEVEVWRRATQLGEIGPATTLTMVQIVIVAAVVGVSAGWQRRHATRLGAADTRRAVPRGRQRLAVAAAVGVAALTIAAPLVAMVERSLWNGHGYSLQAWRSLGNNEIRPGIRLGVDPLAALARSARAAAWATLFTTIVGATAVAAISTLGARSGRVVDVGLMLPLGTSAVTVGLGMLITFDEAPFDWRAQWWLVPVGHALVAAPFVVRSALAVVRSLPPDRASAAATLGAGPIRAWATSVLPAIRRPLTAGAGLAAAISLGEFGATSFLSRTGEETLPIAIDRLLGRVGSVFRAQAFALSTLLAAATIALVAFADAASGWDRQDRRARRMRQEPQEARHARRR